MTAVIQTQLDGFSSVSSAGRIVVAPAAAAIVAVLLTKEALHYSLALFPVRFVASRGRYSRCYGVPISFAAGRTGSPPLHASTSTSPNLASPSGVPKR